MSKESKQMKKLAQTVANIGKTILKEGVLNLSDDLQFDTKYNEKTKKIQCAMRIMVITGFELNTLEGETISKEYIRRAEADIASYLKVLLQEKPDATTKNK